MDGNLYWFKLSESFFERTDIRLLLCEDGGREVVYVYLRLLTAAVPYRGYLMIRRDRAHNEKTLAAVLDMPVPRVREILQTLGDCGLLRVHRGVLFLCDMPSFLGRKCEKITEDKPFSLPKETPNAEELVNAEEEKTFGIEEEITFSSLGKEITFSPLGKEKEEEYKIEIEKETEIDVRDRRQKIERESAPAHTRTDARAPAPCPDKETVLDWFAKRDSIAEGEKFYAYYALRGFRINGEAMTHWPAAAELWLLRRSDKEKEKTPPPEKKESYGNFSTEDAIRIALARSYGPKDGKAS